MTKGNHISITDALTHLKPKKKKQVLHLSKTTSEPFSGYTKFIAKYNKMKKKKSSVFFSRWKGKKRKEGKKNEKAHFDTAITYKATLDFS